MNHFESNDQKSDRSSWDGQKEIGQTDLKGEKDI